MIRQTKMETEQKVLPFLSWPGGKRRLIPEIFPLVPEKIRTYYEPFLGGGAIALAIADRAQEMILSDKNGCVINAWVYVRDCPDEMTQLMHWHKHQHDRGKSYYYKQRDLYNADQGTEGVRGLAPAARFVYLNKACFNGSWRGNKAGEINVPIGDKFYIPDFAPIAQKLNSAALCTDEFDIISTAGKGDLIYLDPPYYADREIASGYGVGEFTLDDRDRMVALAVAAGRRGAIVIGSDLSTPYTRSLYGRAGFVFDSFDYVYCIGGKQKARSISSELIYHNIL